MSLVDKVVPVVQIDRYLQSAAISSVCSNNYYIGREITEIMIRNGHRRIACMCGTRGVSSCEERISGYCDAMTEAGLELSMFGNTFDSQESFLCAKEFLSSEDRPSALVSLANGQFIGILKAAQRLNLRIPDDLSAITVDDNKYMNFITPAITRMAQSMEDMASTCCQILYSRLNGNDSGVKHIRLLPRLIPGNSIQSLI